MRVDKLLGSSFESGALIPKRAKYLTGLIGAPIAQSAAPAMHEAAGDAFGVRHRECVRRRDVKPMLCCVTNIAPLRRDPA